MIPLALIAKIGLGLAKGAGQAFGTGDAQQADPGRGLGGLLDQLKRRRSQGAVLPQTPMRFPADATGVGGMPPEIQSDWRQGGRAPVSRMEPMPMPDFQPARHWLPMQPRMGPMQDYQPMQPIDPGFRPARPRFPGDPGIDPGMTPPPDQSPFGPVPLGGRRPRWRFGLEEGEF